MIDVFNNIANTTAQDSYRLWGLLLLVLVMLLMWSSLVAAWRLQTAGEWSEGDFLLVVIRLLALFIIIVWLVSL